MVTIVDSPTSELEYQGKAIPHYFLSCTSKEDIATVIAMLLERVALVTASSVTIAGRNRATEKFWLSKLEARLQFLDKRNERAAAKRKVIAQIKAERATTDLGKVAIILAKLKSSTSRASPSPTPAFNTSSTTPTIKVNKDAPRDELLGPVEKAFISKIEDKKATGIPVDVALEQVRTELQEKNNQEINDTIWLDKLVAHSDEVAAKQVPMTPEEEVLYEASILKAQEEREKAKELWRLQLELKEATKLIKVEKAKEVLKDAKGV